ncbi:DUF3987 domain-containing protein [Alicyclobacillaceae bacterium I2511]|nr:DUF3987 domain-containing protein [Alicyclobacillaceae bacterium I2511]
MRGVGKLLGAEKLKKAQEKQNLKAVFAQEGNEFIAVPYHETTVDDFPLAVFPPEVRRFVEETADSIPCPRDFAALAVLGVTGGLLGNKRMIEAKPGFRQYAQGWFAIVGAPGSGKTEPLAKAMKPVFDMQTKLWETYQLEKEKYDIDFATWKADKRGHTEPEEPKMKFAYVSDATIEALFANMEVNPNLIAYWDELSGWLKSMNQYKGGAGGDKAHFLSIWSFNPVNIIRMARHNYIPDPHLAIVGGIQPDVLMGLRNEMSEADGFIHRVLFGFPAAMKRRRSDVNFSKAAEAGWKNVCEKLNGLQGHPDGTPIILTLTKMAKTLYNAWQDEHFAEINAPNFPERLEGPWAKLEIYMLRLALTVQMLRVVSGLANDGEIDEESILAAADLVDYFKSHAKKVYEHLSETAEDKQVRQVVKWLQMQEGQSATPRDMQMYRVAGIKTANEARQLNDAIVKRGHAQYSLNDQGKPCITLVAGLLPP